MVDSVTADLSEAIRRLHAMARSTAHGSPTDARDAELVHSNVARCTVRPRMEPIVQSLMRRGLPAHEPERRRLYHAIRALAAWLEAELARRRRA